MAFSRQLLAIAFFIVALEILVVMFIVNATKDKIVDGLIQEEFKKERTLASQISKSLEQDLATIQDELILISQRAGIQSDSTEACNEDLDRVFPILNKKIANLVRIDEDGIIYCAVNRESIGIDVKENATLKEFIDDPSHKPVLHRVVLSPVSNKHVAGIHVPVLSPTGQFRGSIGGVIYFDELEKKYFEDLTVLESGYLMLVDDNGDVLYNPRFKELVGKNLLSEEIVSMVSGKDDYRGQVEKVFSDIRNDRPSFVRYHYPPEPEKIAAYYPVNILPERKWAVAITVPVGEIINQLDEDSLIAGFKNFSTLALAMVVIIMLTQIGLFAYLISHMASHIRSLKNKNG